jgi:hypothetical protein
MMAQCAWQLIPFGLLLISRAGWRNPQQQDVIDCLQEEDRGLREQLGGKRLHFNDDQRKKVSHLFHLEGHPHIRTRCVQPHPEPSVKHAGSENRKTGDRRDVFGFVRLW